MANKNKKQKHTNWGPTELPSVSRRLKEASKKCKDNFYNRLSKDTSTLTAHEKCNFEYKSSDLTSRHLKQFAASAYEGWWRGGAIKRTKRPQSLIPFQFKSDCIFCGIACDSRQMIGTLIGAQKRKGCYHG